MPGSWDSVKRTRWRKAKNRRAVETLGAAAREACGRDRLAIYAGQRCCRTRERRSPANFGNLGCEKDAETTEGKTVGLAIESELKVFKPWGLVDGIDSECLLKRSLLG